MFLAPLLLVLLAVPVAAEPRVPELKRRAERALADPGVQRELPWRGADAAAGEGPRGTTPRGRRPEAFPAPPSALAVAARALLWVLAGALLVAGLAWIFGEVLLRRRDRRARGAAAVAAPEDAPSDPRRSPEMSLAGIEDLARRGEYGEAAHRLLVAALELLARRRAVEMVPGRTSREVLRALPPEGGREALAELVTAVERSLFGDERLERTDYQRCANAYEHLARGGVETAGGAA